MATNFKFLTRIIFFFFSLVTNLKLFFLTLGILSFSRSYIFQLKRSERGQKKKKRLAHKSKGQTEKSKASSKLWVNLHLYCLPLLHFITKYAGNLTAFIVRDQKRNILYLYKSMFYTCILVSPSTNK